MATNIGPKIGIDGEKEYRQQINLIIQQSKTLAAEMKAVTSAFTKDTSEKEKSKKVGEVLTKQIETQRKRVEELAKMTDESAKATGENSRETLSWREALNNATAQLNQLEKGLKADGVATKEYTEKVSGAEKASGTFKDTLKALLVDGAIKAGIEALKKGFRAIGEAVKAAARAAGEFLKDSVAVGMEFDKSISQVAATMGTTTAQIGELRDLAKQLGSTTAFTATEAAEGLNYMALAGYDAATSMQMLPKVLNLAAAGNFDLATASDMLTDTQSALGLSLDETTELIDQMAVTASTTNTDVAGLGEAMLTVGGTAKFMKGGTMEVTRALGILADNGIKASEGGTHLRNMLLKLADPTEDGASALKSLGVEVFDASGQMRSFADIFPELNAGLSSLTDEQKLTALGQIFNTRDIAAAQALLGTSVERWEELGSAIEDSAGAAQKMADTQLDNLAGDLTIFKSAVEGVQLAISDGASPALRYFVQEGTTALGTLTAMLNGDKSIGTGISSIVNQIFGIVGKIRARLPELLQAGSEILTSILQGINEALPQVTEMVVPLVSMIAVTILENLPAIFETGLIVIETLLKGLGSALPELIPAAIECIMMLVTTLIDHIPLLLESAGELVEGLVSGILKALPKLIASAPKIISSIITGLIRGLPQILMQGGEILITLITGLIQAIPDLIMALPQIIMAIIDTFRNTDWSAVGSGILQGIKDGFLKKVSSLWDAVREACQRVLNSVKNFLGIHSPSKVFADQVGEMIPAGIALGIEDNTKDMLSAARSSMELLTGSSAGATGYTANYGGVSINVYASEGQNVNELADVIMDKMQSAVRRREAVFA